MPKLDHPGLSFDLADGYDPDAPARFDLEAHDVACGLLRAPYLGHLEGLDQFVPHLLRPQLQVRVAQRTNAGQQLARETVRVNDDDHGGAVRAPPLAIFEETQNFFVGRGRDGGGQGINKDHVTSLFLLHCLDQGRRRLFAQARGFNRLNFQVVQQEMVEDVEIKTPHLLDENFDRVLAGEKG